MAKQPNTIVEWNGTESVYKVRNDISYHQSSTASNSNSQALTLNVWAPFGTPSGGLEAGNPSTADFSATDTPNIKITYTGTQSKLFHVSAVTNVMRDAGAATRDLQFVWYKNGVQAGTVRAHYMNSDANIVSGIGIMELSENDYLEPYVRNIQSSDPIIIENLTITLVEIPKFSYY